MDVAEILECVIDKRFGEYAVCNCIVTHRLDVGASSSLSELVGARGWGVIRSLNLGGQSL